MDILSEKVLVINKNYMPLCVVDMKMAMKLLFTHKAVMMNENYESFNVEEWRKLPSDSRACIRTPNQVFVAPEVVRLTAYDKVVNKPLCLTRQNIFLRDEYRCQYCGETTNLTLDHVIPRSRAKEFKLSKHEINAWENVVTCCASCNCKKDSRTPKEAQMNLFKKPVQPVNSFIGYEGKTLKEMWKVYVR
jgi:5-methylcytosine-specific restriction endonuclease McrA